MVWLEKWYILTPLQKLPKNVRDLGKLIGAKDFKKLPKVQKNARSGHTGCRWRFERRFGWRDTSAPRSRPIDDLHLRDAGQLFFSGRPQSGKEQTLTLKPFFVASI